VPTRLKVAIVHDWLNQYGGAERVLEVMMELFTGAPIYTSMYEPKAMPARYRDWDIRTSFMQWLPFVKSDHQPFIPLYPLAFDNFDLKGYDLVVSISSAFCHGVVTEPRTCHINYCLTPPRFLWDFDYYAGREGVGSLFRRGLMPFVTYARLWDLKAASRVDYLIAISQTVASRIKKYYRREAAVIYPPIDCSAYRIERDLEDYFLVVSRLIPYKRLDLAVAAFNELGLELKIVGSGRDRRRLERMAGANIQFIGRVSDETLRQLYARCQALIFPGEEDFGLAPLEAMAAGRPVIAYAGGGALETVADRVTGLLFREPTVEALVDAVEAFRSLSFDPVAIRQQALRFDVSIFKERFTAFVTEVTGSKLAELAD